MVRCVRTVFITSLRCLAWDGAGRKKQKRGIRLDVSFLHYRNFDKGKAPFIGAFPAFEWSVLLTISIHGGRIAPHQMQTPSAPDAISLTDVGVFVKPS